MLSFLLFVGGGAIIFLVFIVVLTLLILAIPVFFILKVQLRKPAWNQEIEQIARERGFSHLQSAPLPDHIRAARFPIVSSGHVNGKNRVFSGNVTHLLYGFIGNVEVTMFYYGYFESWGARTTVRQSGTAIAFRQSPNSPPVLYKQESNDFIEPRNLRRFIDENYQTFCYSLNNRR